VRAAVIIFPGSNCDRDMVVALRESGANVSIVWHKDSELPKNLDLVAIPGGFSFGDYLRCGAIAAQSPICQAVVDHASRGGFVLGVCNGFQVLTEAGLIPGALMRNSGLNFLCKTVDLIVETQNCVFTSGYDQSAKIRVPIAHRDGNYFVTDGVLSELLGEDRVAFRYSDNPNGSSHAIAGVLSPNRRVLGMMPHPERAMESQMGSADGQALFRALVSQATAS